jgi:hypothetical protein
MGPVAPAPPSMKVADVIPDTSLDGPGGVGLGLGPPRPPTGVVAPDAMVKAGQYKDTHIV